ncbi:chlorophyll synthesis pathway protein BchC [Ciceribacter sp. L1K22]|uniref:chlorophyll synthesis pathway protein BchC n=1 Tax=Ciceribacter sp. L1K22 TaxID=2820275 RepID=UPI001ABEC2CE|nr:chlorophyll synthesis pathway protein BchC [Ciceribacter sp. L1K22]MBO3761756.1 chlorophyll synthesis pathway protein BchC [Ciceribacter sp. L1K22]
MDASAVVFERPGEVALRQLTLCAPAQDDVVVETLVSGVSTGTEKMLFEGTMPAFPGMGYPLVPGYESVARVVEAGAGSRLKIGTKVFVPGSSCFPDAAGLFGATASRLVVPANRVYDVGALDEDAVLLALAATAHHAVRRAKGAVGLVIGHGVLGRLIARVVMALGHPSPVVWEIAASRRDCSDGYAVVDPADDTETRYDTAIDASGDPAVIDRVVARLNRPAELVLAGFYGDRISCAFAPAFMRELTLSIAAEFRPEDVVAVIDLANSGRLSLKGLVTHRASPGQVPLAYRTAFNDPNCLKMIIDWRKAA